MRNRIEIEVWMKRNNLSVGKIQKMLGYKSHACVANTIAGRENLTRVLDLLAEKGCPVKYLDLPKKIKG
ncbi:hypothetical protein [Desulfocastanea catecholica]